MAFFISQHLKNRQNSFRGYDSIQILSGGGISGTETEKNVSSKRILSTVFLILAILMVLFFTLQDAEGTTALSESVRHWLEELGIKMESHELRSNIHILEYFILGLAVLGFGTSRNWKILACVIICCMIGLIDEGIKVFLPTREFDMVDLIKDWVGVGIAAMIYFFISKQSKGKHAETGK